VSKAAVHKVHLVSDLLDATHEAIELLAFDDFRRRYNHGYLSDDERQELIDDMRCAMAQAVLRLNNALKQGEGTGLIIT
jgi:hypothetical protein